MLNIPGAYPVLLCETAEHSFAGPTDKLSFEVCLRYPVPYAYEEHRLIIFVGISIPMKLDINPESI